MKKNKKLQELADKSLSKYENEQVMRQMEQYIHQPAQKATLKPIIATVASICIILILVVSFSILVKPFYHQTAETPNSASHNSVQEDSINGKFDEITVEQLIQQHRALTNNSSFVCAEFISIEDTPTIESNNRYVVSNWKIHNDYYRKLPVNKEIDIFISVNEQMDENQETSLPIDAIKNFLSSQALYLIYLPAQTEIIKLSSLYIVPIRNDCLYPSSVESFLDNNNIKYTSTQKLFGDLFINDNKTIRSVAKDIENYYENQR